MMVRSISPRRRSARRVSAAVAGLAASLVLGVPTAAGATLDEVYDALRIEHLTTDRAVYDAGQKVAPTYALVNRSGATLEVPLVNFFGTPFHLAGTVQHWILRLGPDPTIPTIPPFVARDGLGRYGAGGWIVATDASFPTHQWPDGVRLDVAALEIDTTGFPNGMYRFFVEHKRVFEGTVLRSASVDFEVTGGTDPALPPAAITLAPADAVVTVGEDHCLTATVRNTGGGPVAGATVDFFALGANAARGERATGPDGAASFCYWGSSTGRDTVGAEVRGGGHIVAYANATWRPRPPHTTTLNPPEATVWVGHEHCVVAVVFDDLGNVVWDTTVDFEVAGANSARGTVVTDETFHDARFCYTGRAVGTDVITATARDGGRPAATAEVVYRLGPATLELSVASPHSVVDSEVCVTAAVRDGDGEPVPGAYVDFYPTFPAYQTGGWNEADSAGNARFCFVSTLEGPATVSASVNLEPTVRDEIVVRFRLPRSTCGEVEAEGALSSPSATFSIEAENAGRSGRARGRGSYRDLDSGLTLRLKIEALVVSGDTASIFGRTVVDGEALAFRIDVTEGDTDAFAIVLANGYGAAGSADAGAQWIDVERCERDEDDGDDD